MKKLSFLMFISAICVVFLSVPVFADYGESKVALIGSIQGLTCIYMMEVCPIGMEDPMLAKEDTLVLLVDPVKADFYGISNIYNILINHVNQTVKVVGYVNKENNSIWVEELYVGPQMELVWSQKMQDELCKK